MTFGVSLDGLAKGITIGVTVLFSIIIGVQLIPAYKIDPLGSGFLILFLTLIYLCCILFRPMSYKLTADSLIIHRLFNDIVLNRKDILIVREVARADMRLTIRTFGVGGLFGYFGKFSNATIGKMTLYATRRDKTVLVETSDKKLILTPDNPAEFIIQLEANS
jgi:Bacterial PH domain